MSTTGKVTGHLLYYLQNSPIHAPQPWSHSKSSMERFPGRRYSTPMKFPNTQPIRVVLLMVIDCICATHKEVLKYLSRAQEYQARNYNKSLRDVDYKIGQKVWLRVQNITVERPSKKQDWQSYGPQSNYRKDI